jgi:hypothetical protein
LPSGSRTSPPFLEGSLPETDLREIMSVVGQSKDVHEPVVSIQVKSPIRVEVWVGEWHGPEQGGGEVLDVRKTQGHWEIKLSPFSRKTWVL